MSERIDLPRNGFLRSVEAKVRRVDLPLSPKGIVEAMREARIRLSIDGYLSVMGLTAIALAAGEVGLPSRKSKENVSAETEAQRSGMATRGFDFGDPKTAPHNID
jgi:hypothetical protein